MNQISKIFNLFFYPKPTEQINFIWVNILLLVVANAASVISYINQMFLARFLVPQDFGTYYSILSILNVLFPYWGVLVYFVAKITTENEKNPVLQGLLLERCFVISLILTVLICLVVFYFRIEALQFLKISDSRLLIVFAILAILSLPNFFFSGIFQGKSAHIFSVNQGFLSALSRTFLMFLLIRFIDGALIGAFLAIIIPSLLIGLWSYWVTKNNIKWPHKEKINKKQEFYQNALRSINPTFRSYLPFTIPIALNLWCLNLFTSLDIALVKHFCSPTDVGLYSAAASLGKIPFFIAGTLNSMLFQQVLKNEKEGLQSAHKFLASFGITFVLATLISGLLAVFPEALMKSLYGQQYVAAAPLLFILAMTNTFVALSQVLFTFLLAKNLFFFICPMVIGVAGFAGGIYLFFHGSILQVAWVMLFAAGFVFLSSSAWYYLKNLNYFNSKLLEKTAPYLWPAIKDSKLSK